LIGIIIASFKLSLAPSSPETSSHFTLGFSVTIALLSAPCNFAFSSSSSPSPLFFDGFFANAEAPPSPPVDGGSSGAI
jgi:hypothetical protein